MPPRGASGHPAHFPDRAVNGGLTVPGTERAFEFPSDERWSFGKKGEAMNVYRRGTRWVLGLSIVTLVSAAGCSDSTGPEDGNSLRLSLVAPAPTSSPAVGPARAVTQTDGSNTLVLERVALVAREIELERALADDCDDVAGGEDDCEELEAGPILLELPLDGTVSHVVSIEVPADTYDEIELDIHKAEAPEDQAFLDLNPGFEGVSIRVEGTWNGESFVFLQDLDEEQEIELTEPLVIEEGAGPHNITLELDVGTWFQDGTGALVDPRTANHGGGNESLVEDNIRQSIEAFEDDDEDGEHDD